MSEQRSRTYAEVLRWNKLEAGQLLWGCTFYPPFLFIFAIWAIFILIGSLFYTYYEEYGWAKGIYYAVNVGFNIGWNWSLEESDGSKVFSIFYLITGFLLLALLVVFVAEVSLNRERRRQHFVRYIEYLEFQLDVASGRAAPETIEEALKRHYVQNFITITSTIVLIVYVGIGALWSYLALGWDALDGFYFSLSSISAGGMYSIPTEADDAVYAGAAVYAAAGIPLMVLTFGFLASSLLLPLTYYEQFQTMHSNVTADEKSVISTLTDGSASTGMDQESSPVWRDTSGRGALQPSSRMQNSARSSQMLDPASFLLVLILRAGLVDHQLLQYLLKKHEEYVQAEESLIKDSGRMTGDRVREEEKEQGDNYQGSNVRSIALGRDDR